MVEQLAVNQWVPGSSPGSRAVLREAFRDRDACKKRFLKSAFCAYIGKDIWGRLIFTDYFSLGRG